MALEDVIRQIKSNPDYKKCGMVLYHNGMVRETSRTGEPVASLEIRVDHAKLERLLFEQKKREGIVDVIVEIYEGKILYPGDDVMVLAVAGDIRSNVKAVLSDTLEAIKTECTSKEEVLQG
ncbi:MAG: molybdenum cofactor biosynthesis protein MoaE [Spirochaetales bacterium]|nr:molybdenum cofactor biosynthesis protein MoaE [Spirochaetales bacterium]